MTIIGFILMSLGAAFFLLGGLGILRMPDVFNRIQAGTKATTLGAFSLLLGIGFMEPSWFMKILLLIVLIAVTNPIGSSVLARAAFKSQEKVVEGTYMAFEETNVEASEVEHKISHQTEGGL